jgi:hypothetical protein
MKPAELTEDEQTAILAERYCRVGAVWLAGELSGEPRMAVTGPIRILVSNG